MYWYEPLYPAQPKAKEPKKWDAVRREEKLARKLIGQSHYQSFIKEMFVRYVRCLDGSDYDSSFLKLWSLLEFVTVIKPGENYDEVIKRTLSLSADTDYDARILEHLRQRRNATVHRSVSSNRAETWIFQLKRFVETLMRFHLAHGRRYSTAEGIGNLLSKPHDVEVLKKRIAELKGELALTKSALRLHEHVATPPHDDKPSPPDNLPNDG